MRMFQEDIGKKLQEEWEKTSPRIKKAAERLDHAAGDLAIKFEEFCAHHKIEDRLLGGAFLGAKTAAVFKIVGASSKLVHGAGVVGFAAGAYIGPKIMNQYNTWRDGHKTSHKDAEFTPGQV